MRSILLLVGLVLAAGCNESSSELTSSKGVTHLDQYQALTTTKLREYCRACHAIGPLRFIFSDDDEQLWADLFSRTAPNRGTRWADAIIEVLDWPSDVPPRPDQSITPSKDWMPKGLARYEMAEDIHNGRPVRQIILDTLR